MNPSLLAVGLAVGASAFLAAPAMAEERRNLIKFGAEHAAYVQTTRRLIPLIY